MDKSEDRADDTIFYFFIIVIVSFSTFAYHLLDETPTEIYISYSYSIHLSKYIAGLMGAFLYLIIGFLGFFVYRASQKLGFKSLWNEEINNRKSLLIIIFTGIIIGVLFIIVDEFADSWSSTSLANYLFHDFPSVFFFPFIAGIGRVLSLNLFGSTLLIVILSRIIKSEDGRSILFWTLAVICSIIYGITMYAQFPETIWVGELVFSYTFEKMFFIKKVIFVLPLVLFSLLYAYFYKRYGLLAPIIINVLVEIILNILRLYLHRYHHVYYFIHFGEGL